MCVRVYIHGSGCNFHPIYIKFSIQVGRSSVQIEYVGSKRPYYALIRTLEHFFLILRQILLFLSKVKFFCDTLHIILLTGGPFMSRIRPQN